MMIVFKIERDDSLKIKTNYNLNELISIYREIDEEMMMYDVCVCADDIVLMYVCYDFCLFLSNFCFK